MLTRLGLAARRWVADSPWTNVYGVARTLLALATLSTLALTSTGALFAPVRDRPPAPYCDGPRSVSYFCVMPDGQLEAARWLAVALLAVVASGWRPRLTALPHWWLTVSLQVSMSIPDGGDQVATNLTLLLLPLALTDRRAWHWRAGDPGEGPRREVAAVVALAGLLLIRLQVAGIYLHASLGKLGVTEWRDGTALHYWLNSPTFGAPGWLREPLQSALSSGFVVAGLTWGTLVLEFALALALFLPARRWAPLLVGGLALHAGIGTLMGLWSFSLAMFAALVLYLRPRQRPFERPDHVLARLPARLRRTAGRVLEFVAPPESEDRPIRTAPVRTASGR
jgi:antimicrobial peptide system SdpB family protein